MISDLLLEGVCMCFHSFSFPPISHTITMCWSGSLLFLSLRRFTRPFCLHFCDCSLRFSLCLRRLFFSIIGAASVESTLTRWGRTGCWLLLERGVTQVLSWHHMWRTEGFLANSTLTIVGSFDFNGTTLCRTFRILFNYSVQKGQFIFFFVIYFTLLRFLLLFWLVFTLLFCLVFLGLFVDRLGCRDRLWNFLVCFLLRLLRTSFNFLGLFRFYGRLWSIFWNFWQ